ncbi:hypothetical protein MTO96_037183, partial [Rhipicephalus appendiculatus]
MEPPVWLWPERDARIEPPEQRPLQIARKVRLCVASSDCDKCGCIPFNSAQLLGSLAKLSRKADVQPWPKPKNGHVNKPPALSKDLHGRYASTRGKIPLLRQQEK